MARIRIRTVKLDLWTHEDLSALPAETHILAAAILNYADDEGFFNANAKLIEAACFPLRELSVNVPVMLQQLEECGYMRFFDGSDGKRYGHVCKFTEHQVISHPRDSVIKLLEISSNSPVTIPDDSVLKGREGNRTGKERKGTDSDESDFHEASSNPPAMTPVIDQPEIHPIPTDSEAMVRELLAAHPRVESEMRAEKEAMDAIIRETKSHGGPAGAFKYLLERTKLYRDRTAEWPAEERDYIVTAHNWFFEKRYRADDKLWIKAAGDGPADVPKHGAGSARIQCWNTFCKKPMRPEDGKGKDGLFCSDACDKEYADFQAGKKKLAGAV